MKLFRLALLALVALPAFAQTPNFSVVDTSHLNATFGNGGKAVLDPQASGFVGVAYGNGLFVAVVASARETVVRWATSPDGTTWTAHSQPLPATYVTFQTSKVHFLNGKFIFFTGFGGGDGSVSGTTWCYSSADGMTWQANLVTNTRINVGEFDASPTLTVAAGGNGHQWASTDLVTWVSRPVVPNGVGYDHNDLTYLPSAGKFFSSINGFGGSTYSSTDAVTWTVIPSATTPGGGTLEAGNGFLLSTAGSHYKSADGATFTKLTTTAPTNWFAPGGSPRYTTGGFVAMGTSLTTFKGGYMVSSDCVAWTPLGFPSDAPKADTGFVVRSYVLREIVYGNGKFVVVGQDNQQAAFAIQNTPLVMTLDAAPAPASTSTTLAAVNVAAGATVQWQRNGANVSGGTSASLTLATVQPADTGLYAAIVTAGGVATAQPFPVGLTSTTKVVGSGTEILTDAFVAANNNTFDQVALQGAAATITADANQITRISFVDLNNDIVQVELSGAGSLSLVLDGVTGPATPANYNQPTVTYYKGNAGIVVVGANQGTNVTIFTVGRSTAVNQSLFRSDVTYDGVADLAFIAISSTDGKFGGLRASNASFLATKGYTGVYAPGVTFSGPVFVGDISASDAATPVLVIGASSDTRITGGDLFQANGAAVTVAGLTQLKFTAGTNSHASTLPAQNNRAVLRQGGTDITSQIVVNPTP